MGAEQAIYLSMGLLAMTSLSGLGVAVGSGVVMMMQEEALQVHQSPAGLAEKKKLSELKAMPSRGFAASRQ